MNPVALIGIPYDDNSSFLRGPALAPGRIREAWRCGAANSSAENLHDLAQEPRLIDLGDAMLERGPAGYEQIEGVIAGILAANQRPLTLGGDHSITYPIIRALARHHPDLTILQIDAHCDLYDELDGNRHSHACPFARIMEARLAGRLVQLGIRTLNIHQKEQAERFGVEMVQMRHWNGTLPRLDGPLYLTLDLDGLDPAFAPGVSHHEPGGLTSRELLTIIQNLPASLVGADIVELNPTRDHQDMTAMVAAKCLKEIAAKMLESPAVI